MQKRFHDFTTSKIILLRLHDFTMSIKSRFYSVLNSTTLEEESLNKFDVKNLFEQKI